MIRLIGDQDCGRSRLADSEAHEMGRIHLLDRANQRPKRLHPRLYAKEESRAALVQARERFAERLG